MAIKEYQSNTGETLWKAYVCVRSKNDPAIRLQRWKFGCKSLKQAKTEEMKLMRDCQGEVLAQEARGSSWGNVVEAFARYLESPQAASLHETTRLDYVATVRKHTVAWWPRSAFEITQAELRELFAQLKAQGTSISHQKKMKNVIHKIFVFGLENKLIRNVTHSPAIGIKFGREEEKHPEILTIKEIRRLLEEARKTQSPWYSVWATALLTGMRNGELYALLWSDVDWVNNVVTVSKSYNGRLKCVKSTKAGYWRNVPMSAELRTLLQEIKANAGDRTHVLPRMWKWTIGFQASELRQFCVGVGLPSIRFHTLRACFATQLIRNGVPPIQVMKICGWKDLKTMQRYIRIAGIEIEGATDSLHVLPEVEIVNKAAALFAS